VFKCEQILVALDGDDAKTSRWLPEPERRGAATEQAVAHARAHFEDPPEIRDWVWAN